MTQLYEDKQPTLNWEDRKNQIIIAHTPYGYYTIMPKFSKGEPCFLVTAGALSYLSVESVSNGVVTGTRDFLLKVANDHYKAFGELRFKPV